MAVAMREYIDGATAIVRGALDAGCDFFAGYPITPASGILMAMMRDLPKTGGTAIQGEDEIASIGMCIGAAMAGARVMTATSGPGMSLYSENIGLAVMGEVPLVIVDVQRLGPATGGATTVSQGDVQFVRWGTAGGYPVIVLSPTDVADCYRLTAKAFALAEQFRCPVFLLTDKEVVMTPTTVEADWFQGAVTPVRATAGEGQPYRFQPAAAVPPLHHLGEGDPVRFTGSTHDESAFITKDPATIDALHRHLIAKIDDHVDELTLVQHDPAQGATTLILGYGVTAGAMAQAAQLSRGRGHPVSTLVVRSLWPVPEAAIANALADVARVVVPELNNGLYRREIERLAGDREVVGVNRVDGDLLSPAQIAEAAA
jgi:2-oxoglutarate ferredoxin oxidoreductase subunit alpha